MIKVHYGPKDNLSDEFRLVPAPLISVKTNYNYSNDHVIGYSYSISINGYATNNRRLNEDDTTNDSNDNIRNISKVLENVEITKNILSYTGGCLTVSGENGVVLLLAKGGSVKSLTFDSSDNRMTVYSKFSAEIEFNELLIGNEQFGCSASYINENTIPNSDLVDINKYKIKEFTDNWTLDVGDEAFNFVENSDVNNSVLGIRNTIINATYSVSATARDFITYDSSGQSLLSPGWIQAKNFIQDRIYKQVSQLDKILKLSNGTTCSTTSKLNQINSYGDGAYKQLDNNYKFYNELITFEASETNGSFSATYSSILKLDNDDSFSSSNVIHTFSKEINVTNAASGPDQTSITINGEIKGLIEGGLIASGGTLSFNQSGSVLIKSNNNSTRFNNANGFVSKIIINDDLTESFKNALGIDNNGLNIQGCGSELKPSSFNLTKNFMEGIITYNASYNNVRACGTSRTTVSVDSSEPVYNELILPNNRYILQFLNTNTSKKINVNMEGQVPRNCCAVNTFSLPPEIPNDPVFPDSVLTQKNINYSPNSGFYRISWTYTCGSGCGIDYV